MLALFLRGIACNVAFCNGFIGVAFEEMSLPMFRFSFSNDLIGISVGFRGLIIDLDIVWGILQHLQLLTGDLPIFSY